MRARWETVLLAISLLACDGEIGAAPPMPTPRPTASPTPTPTPSPTPSPTPPPLTCTSTLNPGRPPLHRLSRLEYERTITDLTGVEGPHAPNFPADASHAGFDHVSDVQTVSLLHAERFEEAALRIAEAVWDRELDPGLHKRWELETRSETAGLELLQQACCGSNMYNNVVANGARGFWTAYRVFVLTELDRPGDYVVRASAWTEGVDPDVVAERPLTLQILLDEQPVLSHVLTATRGAPAQLTVTLPIESAGVHRLDVQLFDPTRYSDPPPPPKVWVDWLSIERLSTRVAGAPKVRRCELSEDGCVRRTLDALVARAYRRPAHADELDRLVALHDLARADGDSAREAFVQVVTAILLSPHFLYRIELDPDLDDTTPRAVSAHELAARLSYFLTASLPDEALRARADDGTLLDPAVLVAEAERLLASPASAVMSSNLGEQWMSLRALDVISPSPELFPAFDRALVASMAAETRTFFEAVFREERPATELVTARFTFLDDRLAAHYGLPPPGSSTPVRVALSADSERGGALGLGSVLALNSTPVRPSAVLRGKWVLSQLLCDEPEAPPFNVPPLSGEPGTTPRQQLEDHARNPACASCHLRMDPIGFALDGFDADGSHRTRDRAGRTIDVSGRFVDGVTVRGPRELRAYIAGHESLERCLAQHLLVYGLARAPEGDDECQAKAIAERAPGASFRDLIREVVTSAPFRERHAQGAGP